MRRERQEPGRPERIGEQDMQSAGPEPVTGRPHCDGKRVLFEVVDEGRSVACAISLSALQDLSARRCHKPAEQLASFAAARPRIEAIALGKLRSRAGGVPELLNIWSGDLDEPWPRMPDSG
jgi:Protein of unknown function (DUF1488)